MCVSWLGMVKGDRSQALLNWWLPVKVQFGGDCGSPSSVEPGLLHILLKSGIKKQDKKYLENRLHHKRQRPRTGKIE